MSTRRTIQRTVLGPLAVSAAAIGGAALTAAPAHATSTGVTVTLAHAELVVTGDASANSLVVGRTVAGLITLNGVPVLGGTATTDTVSDIVMDGGAGNDTLQVDETRGRIPRIQFIGGSGNDQLIGGAGADSLLGGPGADTLVGNGGDDDLVGGAGNDKVIGGPGNDTVSLGEGSDQFTWNPGDGSDKVDGDAGSDTLVFNGSDRAPAGGVHFETENMSFDSDGVRTTIRRALVRQSPRPSDIDVVSVRGVELVKNPLFRGVHTVAFGRGMSGSDVGVIRVDLGPPGRDHDPAADGQDQELRRSRGHRRQRPDQDRRPAGDRGHRDGSRPDRGAHRRADAGGRDPRWR